MLRNKGGEDTLKPVEEDPSQDLIDPSSEAERSKVTNSPSNGSYGNEADIGFTKVAVENTFLEEI